MAEREQAVDAFNNNIKIAFNMLVKIYEDDLRDPDTDSLMKLVVSQVRPMLNKEMSTEIKERNIKAFIDHTRNNWEMFKTNDTQALKEISPFVSHYINLCKKACQNPLAQMLPDMEPDFIKNLLEKKDKNGELCIKERSRMILIRVINKQIEKCEVYLGEDKIHNTIQLVSK